jgi:protein-tyrosine-phosphatase
LEYAVVVGIEEFTSTEARLVAAADRLATELEGIYDRSTIERLLRSSAEGFSGRGVESFVAILAERFARERLRAQAEREGKLERRTLQVVFVSLTGGGRAQIGAALLDRECGNNVTVHSAGSDAMGELDANVRAVMDELGIDLSEEFTRPLTREVLENADVVVTMGRSVGRFDIPSTVRHVDWRVGDPTGAELDEVRRVRDDIGRRVDELARALGATR